MRNKINLLRNYDNFLIITHKKPDGDTTGSASALCQILRNYGKTAYILENPDITPRYAHLITPFYPPIGYQAEFIITTDIASRDLFTSNAQNYEIDLCIDHHYLSNHGFGKENIIENYAACGEIIYEIAKELDIPLDQGIAEAIYTSISTDTGCFKYSNTTPNTHLIAAYCLPFIHAGELNRILFDLRTKARIDIERKALDGMEFYFNNTVNIITISLADKTETGATLDDLDSIAALPRSIEGVLVAITLNEQQNGDIKVSIRSNGTINASDICAIYGGGGHLRAAGCTFINSTMAQVKEKILQAISQVVEHV